MCSVSNDADTSNTAGGIHPAAAAAASAAGRNADRDDHRLFIGCYPTGLVYADRSRERSGDYVRCAYLNYGTLKLDLEKDCPKDLATRIIAHAQRMRDKRGSLYSIAWNAEVLLGSAGMSPKEYEAAYLAALRSKPASTAPTH